MRRTTTIVAAWVTVLLLIGAALLGVASLLTLSGCLTASKLKTWESALLGWARKGGSECVEAVKPASQSCWPPKNGNRFDLDRETAV